MGLTINALQLIKFVTPKQTELKTYIQVSPWLEE